MLSSISNSLVSVSSSVLSGLCSNDCPEDVKVTNLQLSVCWVLCGHFFFPLLRSSLTWCVYVYVLSSYNLSPRLHLPYERLLSTSFFFFSAGRERKAGIYPLLAKVIVSGKNPLYIQEIRKGDLNKWCLFVLEGSVSSSLYVKYLSFSAACKRYAKNKEHQREWELFWSDKLAPDYYQHAVPRAPCSRCPPVNARIVISKAGKCQICLLSSGSVSGLWCISLFCTNRVNLQLSLCLDCKFHSIYSNLPDLRWQGYLEYGLSHCTQPGLRLHFLIIQYEC